MNVKLFKRCISLTVISLSVLSCSAPIEKSIIEIDSSSLKIIESKHHETLLILGEEMLIQGELQSVSELQPVTKNKEVSLAEVSLVGIRSCKPVRSTHPKVTMKSCRTKHPVYSLYLIDRDLKLKYEHYLRKKEATKIKLSGRWVRSIEDRSSTQLGFGLSGTKYPKESVAIVEQIHFF